LRRAALVAACFGLAGCGGGWFQGLRDGAAPAPTEVAVTSDRIVVAGPHGFCVDPTATRDQDGTGFVLLGNCAAIANSRRALQPTTPAVLTATISEPLGDGRLADSLDQLDGFFRSQEGLTLLSRSGDPSAVVVLDTATEGEVFLLHASDGSDSAIAGVQPEYWRAYLDVGPSIATLSVLALEDRGLSREESLSTLQSFVQAVQTANAAPPAEEPPTPPAVAPLPSEPRNWWRNPLSVWNIGIFRQIFE
jgi:hypothetical protein